MEGGIRLDREGLLVLWGSEYGSLQVGGTAKGFLEGDKTGRKEHGEFREQGPSVPEA